MSYHSQGYSQSQPTQQPSPQTQSLVYLSSQLQLLSQRTEQLAHLTAVTAEQASYMRLLGGSQAALFMAAQKVFIPQDEPEQDGTEREQGERQE